MREDHYARCTIRSCCACWTIKHNFRITGWKLCVGIFEERRVLERCPVTVRLVVWSAMQVHRCFEPYFEDLVELVLFPSSYGECHKRPCGYEYQTWRVKRYGCHYCRRAEHTEPEHGSCCFVPKAVVHQVLGHWSFTDSGEGSSFHASHG